MGSFEIEYLVNLINNIDFTIIRSAQLCFTDGSMEYYATIESCISLEDNIEYIYHQVQKYSESKCSLRKIMYPLSIEYFPMDFGLNSFTVNL